MELKLFTEGQDLGNTADMLSVMSHSVRVRSRGLSLLISARPVFRNEEEKNPRMVSAVCELNCGCGESNNNILSVFSEMMLMKHIKCRY